jgi:hypothetical protein
MIDPKTAVSTLGLLLSGLKAWGDRVGETARKLEKRRAAIGAVQRAALATKAYIYDTDVAKQPEVRATEAQLSMRWQEAEQAIEAYDAQLARISAVKALGWADPRTWAESSVPAEKLDVDLLIEQCRWLLDQEQDAQRS